MCVRACVCASGVRGVSVCLCVCAWRVLGVINSIIIKRKCGKRCARPVAAVLCVWRHMSRKRAAIERRNGCECGTTPFSHSSAKVVP